MRTRFSVYANKNYECKNLSLTVYCPLHSECTWLRNRMRTKAKKKKKKRERYQGQREKQQEMEHNVL